MKDMKNVMQRKSYYYTFGCSCGDPDCDIHFFVDNDGLSIFSKVTCQSDVGFSDRFRWFKEFKWRVKTALNVLFKGYIESSSHLLIEDKETIESFKQALDSLKNQLSLNR